MGGNNMHIDEQKKFDIRNIERNIKNEVISQKDYEIYVSKLPDVQDKIFNPEESFGNFKEVESKRNTEIESKKKGLKKKAKGKGK
jgi:hypothetical protein